MSEELKKNGMFNNPDNIESEEENSFFLDVENIEEQPDNNKKPVTATEVNKGVGPISIDSEPKQEIKKEPPVKKEKKSLYKEPKAEENVTSVEPPIISFFKKLKADGLLQAKLGSLFLFVSVLILILLIVNAIMIKIELNKKSSQLNQLNSYTNLDIVGSLKNEFGNDQINTIDDIITQYGVLEEKKDLMTNYMEQLQAPYKNFLTHIFLPSQNIWKDPYTNKISTDIIGEEFLNRNPYLDTNLLDRWGNFFKKVSTGLFNEIKDIRITPISQENGQFKIGINVNFESPDRPAFLMLISKLSTTSSKKNISNINEFVYNVWKVIKEDNYGNLTGGVINIDRTEILTLKNTIGNFENYEKFSDRFNNKNNVANIEKLDKIIGELFYRNIMQPIQIYQNNADRCFGTTIITTGDNLDCTKNQCEMDVCFEKEYQKIDCSDPNLSGDIFFLNWNNSITIGKDNLYATCNQGKLVKIFDERKFISTNVIQRAIELSANCNKGDITGGNAARSRNCYYKFRTKYIDIPELAYTIGDEKNESKDKLKLFKNFIKELPPLMNITAFNFQSSDSEIIQEGQYQFKGDVNISIFGKAITDEEIGKIEEDLGKKCFDKDRGIGRINPSIALNEVQNAIKQLTASGNLESNRTIDLGELEIIIDELNKTYSGLSTYEKAIKLFEIYRMLNNIDICNK